MAQQNAAVSNAVALPPGWEAKYNEQAKRYYFVDHVSKVTQWEDPRLTHTFIWGKIENAKLQSMKNTLQDRFPELVLRETLLKSNFDVRESLAELMAQKDSASKSTKSAGQQIPQNVPSLMTATPKKPTPSSSPKPNAKRGDDFAFLSVKSKFPEVPDFIIQDVLASFNQNEEKTCKELGSMGYNSKKQAALVSKFERAELDKEEKAKLVEKQRNEAFNQVKLEFSSFSDEIIRQVIKKANFDVVDARSSLRQLESKAKLEELLTKDVSSPNREQSASAESKKAKKNVPPPINHADSSSSSTSTVQVDVSSKGNRPIGNDRCESQEKYKNEEPTAKTIASAESFRQMFGSLKVTDNAVTSANEGGSDRSVCLAKGPDPTLRHGPNKNLLTKGLPLANGPDRLLHRGPCKDLCSGPDNELRFASFKTSHAVIH